MIEFKDLPLMSMYSINFVDTMLNWRFSFFLLKFVCPKIIQIHKTYTQTHAYKTNNIRYMPPSIIRRNCWCCLICWSRTFFKFNGIYFIRENGIHTCINHWNICKSMCSVVEIFHIITGLNNIQRTANKIPKKIFKWMCKMRNWKWNVCKFTFEYKLIKQIKANIHVKMMIWWKECFAHCLNIQIRYLWHIL